MKKVTKFIQDYWRHIIIGSIVAVIGYFIVFNGITTMTPGYSNHEIAAQSSSSSLRVIWQNPIDALYKLILWVPFKLGHHSVVLARITAGMIAVASATLFYFVVYSLFSHRIATLTTILFVTSAGFLHASHLGTPLILQIFGIVTLLALVPAYRVLKGKLLPLYSTVVVLTLLLYIPGLIWFVLVGIGVLNTRIVRTFRSLPTRHQLYMAAIVVLLLTPLVWAYIRHPGLLLTSLALPATLPSWHDISTRAQSFVWSLFWAGKGPAEIMLVGAPLLNLIEFSLLFIGISMQFKKPRLASNFFILGATLFIILLIIFGGVLSYVTLTPLLYLLMASGLFYLLTQWHKVFPVNSVAHVVGATLVIGLLAVSSLFHVKAFYTAWPRSDATHAAFSQPQPSHYDKSSAVINPSVTSSNLTF